MPTWPQTEDVSAIGIRFRQDCEKAQVQDMFHCGWLQVLKHLRPCPSTCVIIEQQLQSAIVVELPGPQEAQEEGIIQSGPEIGLFLQSTEEKPETVKLTILEIKNAKYT